MRLAVLNRLSLVLGGLVTISAVTSTAEAQAAATGCSIDQATPKELAVAYLKFNQAKAATDPAQRAAALKETFKLLGEKPEKFATNAAGYNYIISEGLTLWALQPSMNMITTRGAIGYVMRGAEPFDIVAELDSAYTRMEAAAPGCKAEIAQSRSNEVWLALTKKAFDASSANQLDTATYYANRSLQLNHENPFAHHILGTVALAKKDIPNAITHWTEVVKLAGTDTSYRDIRASSLFYLGVNEYNRAQTKTGAEQKADAKLAASHMRMFLADQPDGPDAPGVMSNLATALELAGDSAEVKTIYADMLANPTRYNEFTLTMAGVIASRVNDSQAALKLFKSVVDASPLSRDGLRNYAATAYGLKQFDPMIKPLQTLLTIDPNNKDAIVMLAFAAQGLTLAAKTPADKKSWGDTLLKYSDMSDKMVARVDVTGFQRNAEAAQVTLAIEQMAAQAGTYNVTMEFLDKTGKVVGTDTKPVGPLAKGERKSVVFKGTGPGITGFRYKPLG